MSVVTSSKLFVRLRKLNQLDSFSKLLVEKGIFGSPKEAASILELWAISTHDTTQEAKRGEVEKLYKVFSKPPPINTDKYNKQLKEIFGNQKKEAVKAKIGNIINLAEEALMELTLGMKTMDKEKLLSAKTKLQEALYGES